MDETQILKHLLLASINELEKELARLRWNVGQLSADPGPTAQQFARALELPPLGFDDEGLRIGID